MTFTCWCAVKQPITYCLIWRAASAFVVICRSSITKSVVLIFQEWFHLEPSNFTRTGTLHMTSLAASDRKLSRKNCRNAALGQISWELYNRGSRNFTDISGRISLANWLYMMSLAISARLQKAIKYCIKWVRPAKCRIFRPQCNLESQFLHGHLYQLILQLRHVHVFFRFALGQIWVVRRFALPNQLVSSFLVIIIVTFCLVRLPVCWAAENR